VARACTYDAQALAAIVRHGDAPIMVTHGRGLRCGGGATTTTRMHRGYERRYFTTPTDTYFTAHADTSIRKTHADTTHAATRPTLPRPRTTSRSGYTSTAP
jgi:hypothetical protein